MRALVTESIGTFFLVFAVGLSGNPIGIGLMLAVMIYTGGHISGAHYNPAVSLAVFLRKGITSRELVSYWVAQVVGALMAAMVVKFLINRNFGPAPGMDAGALQVIVAELVCTFALAYVVLSVTTSVRLKGNDVYGFAIGMTLCACGFAAGPVSGGWFNPAVSIGGFMGGGTLLNNLWVYIVAEFAGGALGRLYICVYEPRIVR